MRAELARIRSGHLDPLAHFLETGPDPETQLEGDGVRLGILGVAEVRRKDRDATLAITRVHDQAERFLDPWRFLFRTDSSSTSSSASSTGLRTSSSVASTWLL